VSTPETRMPRSLVSAGFATWVLVAVPTLLSALHSPRFPAWLVAWLVFAGALVLAQRSLATGLSGTAARLGQVLAIVAMVSLLCNGFEGALLVIVAAQLGLATSLRHGLAWIFLQTLAAAGAIGLHWAPRPALLLAPPYLGFQLFVFLTIRFAVRESAGRRALAEAHAGLLRAQAQLDERARLDERIRLAQDLHDALGHHLTAMSLNLEVAAHQTEGPAHENVRTAQSLARLLLHDVKEIAGALKDEQEIDLARELRRLAAEIPAPHVHLDLSSDLDLGTPRRSLVVLRCVQEIVTNAIRHGEARNLWVALRSEAGVVSLAARDDGRGAHDLRTGYGLSGMRRRLEELGGSLWIETGPASGFALRATLPREGPP
jgi:signal transduction histidine kinase